MITVEGQLLYGYVRKNSNTEDTGKTHRKKGKIWQGENKRYFGISIIEMKFEVTEILKEWIQLYLYAYS